MNTLKYLSHSELYALAERSHSVRDVCICTKKILVGWESPLISLPETLLVDIGTLMYDLEEVMTLTEYHPSDTNYWSLDAPIAPLYFPYNLCKISECSICGRCFLRYTESGAYHMENRIRSLDPSLIISAPLPQIVEASSSTVT